MSRRVTRREFMKTLAAISGPLSFHTPTATAGTPAAHTDPVTGNPARAPSDDLVDRASDSLARLNPMTVHVGASHMVLESGPGFRLDDCRSALYSRPRGHAEWMESRSDAIRRSPLRTGGESIAIDFGVARAEIEVKPLIGERVWRFSGELTNTGKTPIELARFHYLDGVVPPPLRFLELVGPREQPTLRSGLATLAPRADKERFWESMRVRWPQLAEPIHEQMGWFVSTDVAALIEHWNSPGWGFGFVGPGTAFGEIGYRVQPLQTRFFLGVLLDNVLLDPGEVRTLESAIVWHGDWQAGLDVWARVCAVECGVRTLAPPCVGYCSWQQKQTRITPRDIDTAAREFAAWPVPPGGRTIQIDDGFQTGPGDWNPNERFRDAWPRMARSIAATGSLPGLWLAPTAIHESSPIVREHPEWLQRLPDGEPAITFSNWGPTHYLEPDHPQVRAWTRQLFQRFSAEGWKYFKIDFTYAITAARIGYDRRKTTFQTLRELFALIREAVGPDVLLNADVGNPARYALGFADAARLGGDIEYHYAGVGAAVRQLLTRTSTNGVWWWNDPDCFTLSHKRLSNEEARMLTGTFGLLGGLLLTSDLPSRWSHGEAAFVRQFWNARGPRPPRHQHVVWDDDGQVAAYRVSYDDGQSPAHRIALYNWSDRPRVTRLRLSDAHLDSPAAWRLTQESAAAGLTMTADGIEVSHQPAHSLRIADLEPA